VGGAVAATQDERGKEPPRTKLPRQPEGPQGRPPPQSGGGAAAEAAAAVAGGGARKAAINASGATGAGAEGGFPAAAADADAADSAATAASSNPPPPPKEKVVIEPSPWFQQYFLRWDPALAPRFRRQLPAGVGWAGLGSTGRCTRREGCTREPGHRGHCKVCVGP
jgi:hypothetical protein